MAVLIAAVVVIAGGYVARTPAPLTAEIPQALRGVLVGLALFVVCGDGPAVALVPRAWGAAGSLVALPLGAALSGLVLTALGLARVPLTVSAWAIVVLGLLASAVARRRRQSARGVREAAAAPVAWLSVLLWVIVAGVLVVVALAPAWRLGVTTIYGQNPDAHQVAGIAVLFQHVPPTGTDLALPIDTVPAPWRFRYPIFYPLAATAQLGHLDPITAFPAMAALLLACLGLGFGAFAVLGLGAPAWSGPLIALGTAVTASTLHAVWHPYWNQLWGMAMFPWALVFGWRAVRDGGRGPILLFGLIVLELGLAYPLALPYPLLIVGALAVTHERWRLIPRLWRSRSWLLGVLAILVLAPAVAGAALKLAAGLHQLLFARGGLWGGDIGHPLPMGVFAGTGGGLAAALAVLAVAAVGIVGLPLPGRLRVPGLDRRAALALGGSVGLLCLLDLRFRLDHQGAYMDYKHLAFVGGLVLCVAAAGLARWAAAGGAAALTAGLVAIVWAAFALPHGHREVLANGVQVDAQMLEIRHWASELPRGASVRVDVPPSGVQLWAVYMLGAHPVDASAPLLGTTYAHANYGLRADYALSLVTIPQAGGPGRPAPRPLFAAGPPLDRNAQFALWRVHWPARLDRIPSTATQALVEP
ncbi:MAG TPA: hypothetical protein VFN55_03185 [Solirubrobacteraceae bacterium]|nr:hypothetical protein [Solirubrobacteraceae bacterium]